MTLPIVAAFGSWKSPVSLDMVAHGAISLLRISLDGPDTYWAEVRPAEGGRTVIVKRNRQGGMEDVTSPGFSVGSMVNEYGTRGFTVADEVIYFSNSADHRVYRQLPGSAPAPITPEGNFRYGSKVFHPGQGRLVCIRENHSNPDSDHPLSEIVSLDTAGRRDPRVLLTDNDFHSSPCVSPDGARLAWLTWDHPNMPWDGTHLWTAPFQNNGQLGEPTLVAGSVDEAVIQPEWSPSGDLYFISDRTGWANLYRWRHGWVEPVLLMEAEFSKANWWVGMCSYGFDSPNTLVCSYVQKGTWSLGRIFLDEGRLVPIEFPFTEMGHGDLQASQGRVALVAGSPTRPMSLVEISIEDEEVAVLRAESDDEIPSDCMSVPEAIEFPTFDGLSAHAFFYPPYSRDFAAPEGEKPPMLVTCHGGPHSAAKTDLNPTVQYWTSRGFAVLDVNYGGSTGYGRDYRERLIGEWGVVDVDDCVNAALYMVQRGDVDGDRIAISGASAGGFTALASLTFRDVFKAGASYFGVSDLEALLTDIHKFDAYSLVGLVGPYPLHRRRYVERSPINFPGYSSRPVIFFQGLDDTIVPAAQSQEMFNALKANGVPTAYLAFEGEQHGFRKAETIKRCLSAEFQFYSRIFGFNPADNLKPVEIENLDE